jgi:hypothetical protein
MVMAVAPNSWLIVMGTITISGAFAARKIMPDWWLLLISGLLEVPQPRRVRTDSLRALLTGRAPAPQLSGSRAHAPLDADALNGGVYSPLSMPRSVAV